MCYKEKEGEKKSDKKMLSLTKECLTWMEKVQKNNKIITSELGDKVGKKEDLE